MIIQKQLANGIKLVAEKMPSFRSVTFGIWVGAGSVIETEKENGISHFIEHMLFKGTNKRSAKDIAMEVDSIGGQINAFTSKECTCYYIKTIDEKIKEGVEILSDLFCNSVFDAGELEKEKGVVIEEIAMSTDNPEELAMDSISSNYFGGCALSKTILGPTENIKSFFRDDLIDYIKRYYTTDNIIISVAGNFEEDFIVDLINKYFADISHSTGNKPTLDCCKAFVPKKRFDYISKDIEQVHICLAYNGFAITDNRKYALNVANNVIGGSMSSRLFQKVREELGMAYAVYSYPALYTHTGMFGVYAGTLTQNVFTVCEVIHKELRELLENGITAEEFMQSKEQIKGGHIFSMESTSSKMNMIGKSMILTGKVQTDEEKLALMEGVTHEEVNNILKDVLNIDEVVCTVVGKIEDEGKLKGILGLS